MSFLDKVKSMQTPIEAQAAQTAQQKKAQALYNEVMEAKVDLQKSAKILKKLGSFLDSKNEEQGELVAKIASDIQEVLKSGGGLSVLKEYVDQKDPWANT